MELDKAPARLGRLIPMGDKVECWRLIVSRFLGKQRKN